jgi:hypothetical protein
MKLSYANVAASLALFIALGGTAVAAATLAPDSVGSPEIRADAVRSSEIAKDAVASPEIAKDAVRSSEIRDASVRLPDIAPDARTALGTNVRVAKKDFVEVPVCVGEDLTTCPDVLKRTLSPGDWLIEARLGVSSPDGSGSFPNRCGLVTQADTTAPLEFHDPGGHRRPARRRAREGQPGRGDRPDRGARRSGGRAHGRGALQRAAVRRARCGGREDHGAEGRVHRGRVIAGSGGGCARGGHRHARPVGDDGSRGHVERRRPSRHSPRRDGSRSLRPTALRSEQSPARGGRGAGKQPSVSGRVPSAGGTRTNRPYVLDSDRIECPCRAP